MTKDISFTSGSLFKNIFAFSIPLVFTNILQILFNMADSAVVGRFAGSLALGSVGSTGQLIFLFTGLLIGISGGINVLVAFYIGKKSQKDIDQMLQTAFVVCLIAGTVIFLAGFVLAPAVLSLIGTKPELFDDAVLYFRIYLVAMPFLAVYNFGNAVLSSYGNTKLPLLLLALAGIANVLLDLLLVIVFHMSVAGVAIASVVAQCISCVLIIISLLRGVNGIKFSLKGNKINREKLFQIIKIGIPSGLQNSVFAIANLFIQSGVNSFDAEMVAGNAATMNGDNLVYNVMAAFYTACATFIGQNYGAKNRDRMKHSYYVTLFYSWLAGTGFGIILFFFGREFLSMFTTDSIVVDYALRKFKIMTFSFGISAFMDNTTAANRGIGRTFIPSIMIFLGSCVFRVLWIYTVFASIGTVESLFFLYPVSWGLTAVLEIVYFIKVFPKKEEFITG